MAIEYVTPHFTLAEWTTTSVDIDNVPTTFDLWRMRITGTAVLEPWRAAVGPLRVTSGYRSRALNDELRRRGYTASPTSQHLIGEAVDVVPLGWDVAERAAPGGLNQIRSRAWDRLILMADAGLSVDEAIIYEDRGHIHVSCTWERAPRKRFHVHTRAGSYPL
ncbi:MAG: D-Ala-D-Ala carboxypeptidase family metallohydrolase, partial [Actinobacteria bacterium]|nr:D-Ala-D-Ala carboxypeptidase family metallohydrolase [Actinomycetota bacterium]